MLLSLDYSQCEFRVAAELSADANLIRAFETGKDPYAELAAECSITRREAKIVSIGKFTAVPTASSVRHDAKSDSSRSLAFPRVYAFLTRV